MDNMDAYIAELTTTIAERLDITAPKKLSGPDGWLLPLFEFCDAVYLRTARKRGSFYTPPTSVSGCIRYLHNTFPDTWVKFVH